MRGTDKDRTKAFFGDGEKMAYSQLPVVKVL
jgi:hypothetical protein